MNQLLVSGKVYMTPELKKKKLVYKTYLLISVFVICVLVSYYIYGEYQGFQDEVLAQEILDSVVAGSKEDTTMAPTVDDVIVVYLDDTPTNSGDDDLSMAEGKVITLDEPKEVLEPLPSQYVAANGKTYDIVGIVKIPKIELEYPILSETSDALLKVSVCKFWGPNPNEVGNLCIAGHNYTNTRAFSKIYKLEKGDVIEVIDLSGKTIKYEVYTQYIVKSSDTTPTSQITHGRKEVTLITCTNGTKERRIIKALEITE